MAIDLSSITQSKRKTTAKTVLYGVAGIGKTYFAAHAPDVLFACAEDGLNMDGIANVSIKSYSDIIDLISSLYKEEHKFKTLVLDSVTAFEPMLHTHLCAAEGVADIERVGGGFAKYRVLALPLWTDMLAGFDALNSQGVNIIVIGHSTAKEVRLPDCEPFLKYSIDVINPKAADLLYRWSDIVGFANYKTMVTTDDGAKKTGRGIGTGERALHLEERPAHHAKNRFSLPAEMPFDYATFASELAAPAPTNQPTGE